jgi:hypothetical protein
MVNFTYDSLSILTDSQSTEVAMLLDDNTLRNLAVTFFYAIYWGAMISSMPKYNVFQIWTIRRPGNRWRPVLRLIYGVTVLNILPLLLFAFIYKEPWFTIVPKHAPRAFLCSGIASLSVFSCVFLLPGLLQAGLGRILYPSFKNKSDLSWISEALDDGIEPGDPWWSMIITFVLYLIIPISIAAILAQA